MTEKKQDFTTAGSDRIPQRRVGEGSGKPRQRDPGLTAGLRNEEVSVKPLRREAGLTAELRNEEVSVKPLRREVRLEAELRSAGISGPSREVSQCDQVPSGAACAGRDDDELRWAQKHVPEDGVAIHAKRSVFRKTELHHASPGSTGEGAAKARKRVNKELDNPTSGVTLRPYETAFRDLICSIVGHQDLAEEKFFLDIADLQQQITEIQEQVAGLQQRIGTLELKPDGTDPVVPAQTPTTDNPEGYV